MERQQQAIGSQGLSTMEKGSSIVPPDSEAHVTSPTKQKKPGGWKTFPFITGTLTGLILGGEGWKMNLIVFLIGNFNTKNIYAAQVYNIVNGCTNFLPVIGAIAADSFLGSFLAIFVSSVISLLGTVLLLATVLVKSLKPQPCQSGSELCEKPEKYQFAVLYAGIALATIGLAGTRFTLGTMGANQLRRPKDQSIFFNWYFFTFYMAIVVSTTAIVYIEDNVSWGLGLGLCVAANSVALIIFWLGNRFYVHDKPQGSPYTSLAQVVVAAIRKRKIPLSSKEEDYLYQHDQTEEQLAPTLMEKSFRFLNRAALVTEGDMRSDGSVAKPWRLCNLQQVEDLKSLVRILPLWSTGVFLSTPIAVQNSLTVLQALLMDRHLGPHFKIPAGSIIVLVMLSASVCLTLIERVLNPMWRKLFHRPPTDLQRIGVGHVINVMAMVVSAIVESRRLRVVHSHHLQAQPNSVVPMSAMWLFPQLILVGIGEACHFPGQVALYYQEFPRPLKSTATAMIGMVIGIAYYLSTAVVDLVQRCTGWLPDDLNQGRLDNVYWLLVVFGVANFVYYLVCSWFYKYQNVERVVEGSSVSDK